MQVEFGLKAPDPNKKRKPLPYIAEIAHLLERGAIPEKPRPRAEQRLIHEDVPSVQQERDRLVAQKKAKDKARAKRKQAKKQKKRK